MATSPAFARSQDINHGWTFPVRPDYGALADLAPEIWFSGHCVNMPELSRSLRLAAPATHEDVVGALFERDGVTGLGQLRGTFATAIVDYAHDQCLIVRDHVGAHPLFYVQHGEWVSVGTSAAALAQLPGVSSRLNRAALADALCNRYPQHEETFFASVRRVPAGSVLRIGRGRLSVERYWHPVPTRRTRDDAGADATTFATIQQQAVRRAMGPGTTGIFLSGGLDSVSVAAVAADIARIDARCPAPVALSLGLPDAQCDERPIQQAVASALGLPQHLLDFDTAVGETPLLEQAIAISRHVSSPLLNLWTPPYLALARLGRTDGVSTVMTGIGGDEWLSASGYVTADYLWRGRIDKAAAFVRDWNRSEQGKGLFWNLGLRPVLGRAVAKIAPNAWHRRRSAYLTMDDPAWIAPDRALRATQFARAEGALGVADPAEGFAGADANLALRHSLTSRMFEEYFDVGPLAGVQFSHPYFDADLIEFACAAPLNVLNQGGWLKGLLRTQLASRLPSLGFYGQRKVLADTLHRHSLADSPTATAFIRDGFAGLSDLGIVDGPKVRAMLKHPAYRRGGATDLNLINLEAWVRSHA